MTPIARAVPRAVLYGLVLALSVSSTAHSIDASSRDAGFELSKRQSVGAPFSNSSSSGPPSPLVLPSPNIAATEVWASSVERARAFVAQLTLPEKINLTTGVDITGRCVGNTGSVPRLNFTGICLQDSPLGVRQSQYVSAFPAALNAALTWDPKLIYERAKAIGEEFRGKGMNVALGPMMNLARTATGGRNWEGFGADPYLSSVAAGLTTEGIQSSGVIACAKHYIANEQEHFRGGSVRGGQNGRASSSDLDDRTLREIYLPPFRESVRANVGCVMCSYNRINSTFACENSKLMNGILKSELNFQGFVVSDWAAMVSGAPSALAGVDMNMPGFIGYGIGDQNSTDPARANNSYWGAELLHMVQNGTVPEWRVDDMVTRTLSSFFQLSQDKGFPAVNEQANVQGNHSDLIREIGAASTVLLKNVNSALPIKLNSGTPLKNIAIIGSDAGPNPDGPNGCASPDGRDRGCSQGTLAMGWGSGTAEFPYLIDPLSAITQWIRKASPGTIISSLLNDFNLPQARKIARQADVSLVFVNSDSGEGYIVVDGNAGDRNNLTLWHGGDALINATASECKNTIVVIHAVGQVNVEKWIDHPNVTAVLFAGLPGQESGNSLVDVLSGAVNPSARLPFTIAKDDNDYSAQVVYAAPAAQTIIHIPYSENLEIDYRHFDAKNIEPRFAFGHGLSYTTFEYSDIWIAGIDDFSKRMVASKKAKRLAQEGAPSTSTPTPTTTIAPITTTAPASTTVTPSTPTEALPNPVPTSAAGGNEGLFYDAFTITFNITNTGPFDGSEVAQLYVGFPEAVGEPPRLLKGFQKQFIKKGERAEFSIPLKVIDLCIWDTESQDWYISNGSWDIYIGASSRDIRLKDAFSLGDNHHLSPY